jgi:YidC/Oxa1 family membrane protein insertase
MSNLFGVPVHAAYYVVTALAGAITPLTGGLAVALAIVVFTVTVRLLLLPFSFYALRGQVTQTRLAPQIQALRRRHRKDPDRLTREVRALYRAHGTSMFAGYLPLLLQWPFLSVMYLLFRSGTVNGAPNALLRHHLLGAELGAHWLSGAGPLSLSGAVFAALFALLALTGYLSVRINRRLFPPPSPTPATRPTSTKTTSGTRSMSTKTTSGTRSMSTKTTLGTRPTSTKTTSGTPVTSASTPAWLTNVLPLVTVVFAAFLPLAAGLYLLTTTAWTLLERRVLAGYVRPVAPPPAPAVRTPAAAG